MTIESAAHVAALLAGIDPASLAAPADSRAAVSALLAAIASRGDRRPVVASRPAGLSRAA